MGLDFYVKDLIANLIGHILDFIDLEKELLNHWV